MTNFMKTAMTSLMLMAFSHVQATVVQKQSFSDPIFEPNPVVDCVSKQSSKAQLIYQIDDEKALYTHPCSGGVYLMDSLLNPDGVIDKAVAVVQGWWLHSINKVVLKNKNHLVVSAQFITGVGPVGSRPFTASVQLKKIEGNWFVGEPTHGKGAISKEMRHQRRFPKSIHCKHLSNWK